MLAKATLEPGQKIYQSLCYVLSNRASQVSWDRFTPADWEIFSQMADREGVAPLMYWKLKDSPVSVPPSTFNFLRSTYYQTLAQNTLMYQELNRVLEALVKAEIPVIVLKGAALAATMYEDIGLRPMGDLDLLVKRECIDKATQVMLATGYRENSFIRTARIHQLIAYHVQFIKLHEKRIITELHWELIAGSADQRSPSIEWFWNNSERFPQNLGLEKVFTLIPVAHFLHLVGHLQIKHNPEERKLLWLYDIHNLLELRGEKFDWKEVILRADTFNWSSGLISALRSANRLFDTPIDHIIFSNPSKDNVSYHHLAKKNNPEPETRILHYLRKISTLNREAKLLLLFSIILPTPAHIKRHYAPKREWMWPLYYPYRWCEIIVDVIRTLLKLG
jgi:hypothetical protein